MRTNRRLVACLIVLLMVAVSLPTAAYSEEEVVEIEGYILTLEQTIENQAGYIGSLERQNNLLEMENERMKEELRESRWERWKGRGEGMAIGVVLTTLYVAAN